MCDINHIYIALTQKMVVNPLIALYIWKSLIWGFMKMGTKFL